MSTADALTIIAKRVYQALDKNCEVQIVALDISKATDSKLKGYGISG